MAIADKKKTAKTRRMKRGKSKWSMEDWKMKSRNKSWTI